MQLAGSDCSVFACMKACVLVSLSTLHGPTRHIGVGVGVGAQNLKNLSL